MEGACGVGQGVADHAAVLPQKLHPDPHQGFGPTILQDSVDLLGSRVEEHGGQSASPCADLLACMRELPGSGGTQDQTAAAAGVGVALEGAVAAGLEAQARRQHRRPHNRVPILIQHLPVQVQHRRAHLHGEEKAPGLREVGRYQALPGCYDLMHNRVAVL